MTNLDTWDTTQMEAAISEVGSKAQPEQNFQGPSTDPAEAERRARERGYKAKVAYDYSAYQPTGSAPAVVVAKAGRYEFCAEYGDVGPVDEKLEEDLFSIERTYGKGEKLSVLEAGKIEVEGKNPPAPAAEFKDMGLHPIILETLDKMHYDAPTAIQTYAIPAVLTGRDLVGTAQTGSGKTAAYLIPTISRLMGKAKKLCAPKWDPTKFDPKTDKYRAEPLLLVVLPTRELAWQVFDEARRLCYRSMLRPCVVYGGAPSQDQREELHKGCDILIATPGRLKDFLTHPNLLVLSRLKYTIIDEADELLQNDWQEELNGILGGGDLNEDSDHIFMMFSATFPGEYRKIAKQHMQKDFLRIIAGRVGATHRNIKQVIKFVTRENKNNALWDEIMAHPPGRTMVFVNSKVQAERVDDFLYNNGLPSTSLHGDRTQREREDAISSFRRGDSPVLVTTGVAARGIDIPNVMHVINYDLPSKQHGGISEYIHRIGRTARLGHLGLATSFYNDRDSEMGEDLVMALIENGYEVPDFLDEYRPIDGAIAFPDDASDKEDDATAGAGGDGWGGDVNGDDSGNGWGGANNAAGDNGFTPAGDGGFKADDVSAGW